MTNSLPLNLIIFILAATVIAFIGTKLTSTADRLADATGLGEAVFGAIILGASTSLPGIVTSTSAAASGHPELAISNALGGIAAQTAFLSIADLVYRQTNLEYAAASLATLLQGTLLITLLAIPLMGMAAPPFAVVGVNPASILLVLGYIFGLRLTSSARSTPMWKPRFGTRRPTEEEEEEEFNWQQLTKLWLGFAISALITAVAGYILAQTGVKISAQTGISETLIGGLLTATSTSLPELVTSVAAVKQGALNLAVGGIIGGNSFDVLLLAFSDFAYRSGSIYHYLAERQIFVVALTISMTGVLLLGLLRREKYGIANIGFESFTVLALYISGFVILSFST